MGIDSEDPLPAEGALSTKQVRAFLKGEPKTLGAIQIIIGVLTLCLSVTLLQEPIHFLGDVKVLIVVFVQLTMSGSAFVHAGRKPSLFWVKTSLVLNLVSAAFSTAALGLLSKHVPYRQYSYHCEHCRKLENYTVIMIEGVVGTLILFLVLELLICITGMLYGLSVLANGALQLAVGSHLLSRPQSQPADPPPPRDPEPQVTAGTRVVTIPNIQVQAPPQAPPQASPQAPPQVVVQAPPQVVVQAPSPRPASPPSEPQVEPVEEANMP
ncbi:membrane-spanning 4-domains subfamily A member 15-like isoform X1 [Anguilla rostrata]|uniref:membrane-spanning 4-domains subfamily A member 15-like isoform X1 n=1 Tax=Anguilla rostrata TaxID=7938 RepID=UPI0030D03932